MSIVHKGFLSLIRCCLFDEPVNESLFTNMDREDWACLLNVAQKQGVCAIVFNAFEKSGIKPPLDILRRWFGLVSMAKSKYEVILASSQELSDFFSLNGIEMLVMKGLSLTHLYPCPEFREFGDLDIYTYDSHKKANDVLAQTGKMVEKEVKHDMFNYKNVHVEHHNTFIGINSKASRMLNDYLAKESEPSKCIKRDRLLCPSADFNAVMILRHTIWHLFYEGIILRQIIDWGLFLLREGNEVDWYKVQEVLEKSKMQKAFDVTTMAASIVLNVDLSPFYINQPDETLAKRMISEAFAPSAQSVKKDWFLSRISQKVSRAFTNKWVFDTGLLPDKFWSEFIWNSIKIHIMEPKYI